MIHFELVTLDGTKFGEDVYEVVLPTPEGYIGIFPHHMPLVSIATPGVITIRRNANDPDVKLEYFATNGGVIEILDDAVRVLADEADREDEINEAEAEAAFQRAEKLRSEAKTQVEIDQAQSQMDRSSVRLHVAGLRRRHRERR